MIRCGKTVVGALSAMLVVGVCGVASAQSTAPNDNTAGQNSAQANPNDKMTKQEHFDREKVTLKDQVQQSIDSANANIDALKKMSQNEKGQTKDEHQTMEKRLSTLRDHAKNDLSKIDNASMASWNNVRPVVESDLASLNSELQQVASITNLQPPTTGAANKQPQSH